jgi:YD repeat-containing protein
MSAVKGIPIKDVALLRMALQRSDKAAEEQVEQSVSIAMGLNDPEVAAQTVAVIGHLADRLRTAELNQTALVDVLQAVAADSTSSRNALLEALAGITERLAEAPQVHVTVPVPEVNVNVEQAGKRVVELQRDSAGKLVGATTGTRTIELERDATGKLVGATVEEEGADSDEEAA